HDEGGIALAQLFGGLAPVIDLDDAQPGISERLARRLAARGASRLLQQSRGHAMAFRRSWKKVPAHRSGLFFSIERAFPEECRKAPTRGGSDAGRGSLYNSDTTPSRNWPPESPFPWSMRPSREALRARRRLAPLGVGGWLDLHASVDDVHRIGP